MWQSNFMTKQDRARHSNDIMRFCDMDLTAMSLARPKMMERFARTFSTYEHAKHVHKKNWRKM